MNIQTKQGQEGWTLLELLTVMIILAVLFTWAYPYYYSYKMDARVASLKYLQGTIASVVYGAQTRYIVTGVNPVVTWNGNSVVVNAQGDPSSLATGLPNAMSYGGFVYTPGALTGTWDFNPSIPNCNVVYTGATGSTVLNTSGC